MLNINCTIKCAYQKDGKCTMESAESTGHSNGLCAYFRPVEQAPLNQKRRQNTDETN